MIATPHFYDVRTKVQQTLSSSPITSVPSLPWVGSEALSSNEETVVHAKRDIWFTPEGALNKVLTQDKLFNRFLQELLALRLEDPNERDGNLAATGYAVTTAVYVSLLPRMMLGSSWKMPHVATDGYGGIRMSWIGDNREVRAVIPPDANPGTRRRYIYWDSGEQYGSIPNFTPSSLRTWLAWFQGENAAEHGFHRV
jgi:hypothetical protein